MKYISSLIFCLITLSSWPTFALSNGSFMPVAVCQTATVTLDANGSVEVQPADIDGGSTVPTGHFLTVSPAIFDCFAVGTPQTIRLFVRDQFGIEQSSCTTTVTITDNLPPAASCQDVSIFLDANGVASTNGAAIDNGSSDNCGIASTVLDQSVFDCSEIGLNPVVLTVTDVNGNAATCNATVTVVDNILPVVTCPSTGIATLDLAGNAFAGAFILVSAATDNCSAPFPLDFTLFNCSDLGSQQNVTFTSTDPSGNVGSCTTLVTIIDNIAPTAVCQNITVQLDANGQVSVAPNLVDNGSTDNCAVTNYSLDESVFDCSEVGANPVTLTVSDASNNTNSCTAIITVEDNVPPNPLCSNVTVPLDANGQATINASLIDGGSSDNCALVSALTSVDITNFDCSDIGPNPVILSVTDVNSNVSTCNATVTIVDNLPPVLTCAGTTNIPLNINGIVTIDPLVVLFGLTDNCSVTFPFTPIVTFDCTDLGPQNYNLTITDDNGNAATCNNVITIIDNLPPTALCTSTTAVLDVNGQVTVNPANLDGGSTDNCGTLNFSLSQTNFDCSHVGSNNVTLTVTDGSANAATCATTVTISDNLIPTALCTNSSVNLDANGEASITAATVDAGSSDNCAIQSTTIDKTNFDCNDLGPNIVTLTATDIYSNVNTCTATVTIVDNTPPVLTCQSSTTVQLDAAGFGATGPFFLINSITDNCSVPYPNNNVFLGCNDVGQQNFIINATDPSGNTASCTVLVTVVDNIAPTVSCKTISVSPPQGGSVSISPEDVEDVLSSDACGLASKTVSPNSFTCNDAGANPVTFTVTDVNGNVSSCNATVNVSCLLPVEWGSFDGFLQENDVVLEWTTLQEENNAYFQIEHSTSGIDFVEIGRITGQGDSFDTQAYQFIHSQASLGANYYRIKQVDHDGVSSISSVIQVEVNSKTTETALQVFPNPSQDRLFYKLPVRDTEDLKVLVYNKLGQVIHTASYSRILEVDDWDPGIYWLIVSDGREQWRALFVVQ